MEVYYILHTWSSYFWQDLTESTAAVRLAGLPKRENRLNLASLIEPIVERLPEDRREIMEALVAEFGPGDGSGCCGE